VRCRCSRSASSSVVRVSRLSSRTLPLTCSVTLETTGAPAGGGSLAATVDGSVTATTDVAPAMRKSRRVRLMSLELLIYRTAVDDISRRDGAVCDDSSLRRGSRILILSCMHWLAMRECSRDELPHGYRMLARDYI